MARTGRLRKMSETRGGASSTDMSPDTVFAIMQKSEGERDRPMRYSGFRVIKEALTGHKGWQPVWRDPAPQAAYDYIIVGGGGHGLATAYYLAREFRQARIAVLEKSYLGSGNVGRNTTIIRSNYLLPGNEPFYEFSMKLWEGLEQEFNFNAMVSQRGILNLIHTDGQRDAYRRRGNAMLLAGADAELLEQAHDLGVEVRRAGQAIDFGLAFADDRLHAPAGQQGGERRAHRPQSGDQDAGFVSGHRQTAAILASM